MTLKSPPRVKTGFASNFITLESYTTDGLLISKADGDHPTIGKVYEMSPLAGGGGEFGDVVTNLFKTAPDDSVINVTEICVPDLSASSRFLRGKSKDNVELWELMQQHADLIDASREIGWQDDLPLLNKKSVIISLSIPTKTVNEEAIEDVRTRNREFLTNLKACGFWDAEPLTPAQVVGVYRQFGDMFSARSEVQLDPTVELRYQFYGPDTSFDFRDDEVGVLNGNTYCAGVTLKAYSRHVRQGHMNLLIGAPLNKGPVREGGGQRVQTPFIISTTLRVADQRKEAERVERAISSREKKQLPFTLGFEDTEGVLRDLRFMEQKCSKEKDKYIYASTNVFLFGKTREQVQDARTLIKNTLNAMDHDARDVASNLIVRFVQSMPLNYSTSIANKLACEGLMPATSAACILPIYGDYKGNVAETDELGGIPFMTRRGEAFAVNIYKSQSNYNGYLVARSGAGKTMTIQYMMLMGLAEGVMIAAWDNGRSMEKMTRYVGGDFIDFRMDALEKPSLNPFTHLTDETFIEEQENITSLLMLMSYAAGEDADAGARIAMLEAVKAAYAQKQEEAEVNTVIVGLTNIAQSVGNARDRTQVQEAALNLVPRLRAFMDSPARGGFFRGPSTLDPKKRLTVYDMKGLEGDPHLREVVQFFSLNATMSKMGRLHGIPKMVVVDEAQDHIRNARAAKALDDLYSKGRKAKISTWVITQSPMNLNNEAGAVILSQSAWKWVMAQEPEEIDKAKAAGVLSKFSDDAYFERVIKDVDTRKGVFSEILIMNDRSYEVVRLYVPRFMSTMLSSEGAARDGVFELMDKGVSAVDAVYEVMGDQDRQAAKWFSDFISTMRKVTDLNDKDLVRMFKAQVDRSGN